MKKLLKRANHVLNNEVGASNVEIIVWMSVVLTIATVLFLFKDSIIAFIQKVIGKINGFTVG